MRSLTRPPITRRARVEYPTRSTPSTHWAYTSRIAWKQSLLQCQDQFGGAIDYNDTIASTQAETISHPSPFKGILKSNIHTNILSLKENCWHVQFPNDKSICDNKWCSMLWLKKLNITSHHTTRAELLSCMTLNFWTI